MSRAFLSASDRFWPAQWFGRRAWVKGTPSTTPALQGGNAAGESASVLAPTIKDIVFIHIPKTAGTSMRHMLSAALPTATKIFDYGADTAALIAAQQPPTDVSENGGNTATTSRNIIDAFASDIRTPEKIIALRGEAPRGQQFLVASQLPISHWTPAFHPASIVTFLRDPVDRVVSSYRMMHFRQEIFTGSFAEFYESPTQVNVQCRQLRGIDLHHLGFVGLVEFMPDMLKALSRHLGAELRMRHDNTASRLPQPRIDAATRSRILALNEDDLCLYRHVKAKLDFFTNHRERPSSIISSKLARGEVYWTVEGTLKGWALAHDPGQLATIEVRAGGHVVRRCYADQFLPWLKKITPHGVGGFEVRLPADLAARQKPIRVVIAGMEKDLGGSPFIV